MAKRGAKWSLNGVEELIADFFLSGFRAARADFEIAVDEGVIGLIVSDAVVGEFDGAGADAADGEDAVLGNEDLVGFG